MWLVGTLVLPAAEIDLLRLARHGIGAFRDLFDPETPPVMLITGGNEGSAWNRADRRAQQGLVVGTRDLDDRPRLANDLKFGSGIRTGTARAGHRRDGDPWTMTARVECSSTTPAPRVGRRVLASR